MSAADCVRQRLCFNGLISANMAIKPLPPPSPLCFVSSTLTWTLTLKSCSTQWSGDRLTLCNFSRHQCDLFAKMLIGCWQSGATHLSWGKDLSSTNRPAVRWVPPFRSHARHLISQEFHLVFQLQDFIFFMVQDAAAYFSHRKCRLFLSSPLPSIGSFSYWLSTPLSRTLPPVSPNGLLLSAPSPTSSSLVLKCSPSPLTHFIDFAPDADPHCHRFTVTESINRAQANGRGPSF